VFFGSKCGEKASIFGDEIGIPWHLQDIGSSGQIYANLKLATISQELNPCMIRLYGANLVQLLITL
jgi:hypothetical protein